MHDANVLFPTLNGAHVGAIDLGEEREALLGYQALTTSAANCRSEGNEDRVSGVLWRDYWHPHMLRVWRRSDQAYLPHILATRMRVLVAGCLGPRGQSGRMFSAAKMRGLLTTRQ